MSHINENIDHFLEPSQRTGESFSAQHVDGYLDAVEERWNLRIDRDVKELGDGLEKLMEHFQHGLDTTPHRAELASLALETTTSSIELAAERLLALTHQLKLLVLLSDDAGVKAKLQQQQSEVQRGVQDSRAELHRTLGGNE